MVVLECEKNKSHKNCLPKFFEEKKPSQELLFFINVLEELLINCILHIQTYDFLLLHIPKYRKYILVFV